MLLFSIISISALLLVILGSVYTIKRTGADPLKHRAVFLRRSHQRVHERGLARVWAADEASEAALVAGRRVLPSHR